MKAVQVKRVYDPPAASDGYRILVDRLWPRGMTKEEARVDVWLKDVGPSHELRHWFGHDPALWADFQKRYAAELKGNPALDELRDLVTKHAPATLLFGARDEAHNNAVVLQGLLGGR